MGKSQSEYQYFKKEAEIETDVVYKYTTWSKYSERMLANNQIYFASPGKFNDPFDCAIVPSFRRVTRSQKIRNHASHLMRQNPTLAESAAMAVARRNPASGRRWVEMQKRVLEYQKFAMNQRFGVFSLTTKKDNLLMWSHYADSHKGLCVGFRLKSLFALMEQSIYSRRSYLSFEKVNYVEKYPVWNFMTDDSASLLDSVLKTKSVCWQYENEYRMIQGMMGGNGQGETLRESERKTNLEEDAIAEVILGINTSDKDKNAIAEILKAKKRRPRFFQATKSNTKFELALKKRSYNE